MKKRGSKMREELIKKYWEDKSKKTYQQDNRDKE
jgi:hypothetical protein